MPPRKDDTAKLLHALKACCKPLAKALLRNEQSISSIELTQRLRRGIESLVLTQLWEILELPSDRVLAERQSRDGLPACRKRWLDDRLEAYPTVSSLPRTGNPAFVQVIDHELRECLKARGCVGRAVELLGRIHLWLMEQSVEFDAQQNITIHRSRKTRRNGGVYYTPQFIVDYIVRSTIVPWLQDKTPAEVAELRILDPACGTGAFLVSAYRTLLNWHSKVADPRSQCQSPARSRQLSTNDRLRILRNNIFGVDIDGDAVRLTRMSLLLEAFCVTGIDAADAQILPDETTNNVLAGDALGGSSFNDEQNIIPASNDTAVHWRSAFPSIADANGFDIVIGNPPYRRELNNKHRNEQTTTILARKYRTARMDLWYYFLHRGLELLKPDGVLSFITPAYWTNGAGAEKLIAELSTSTHIDEIFHLGKSKVFERVTGQHTILRLTKTKQNALTRIRMIDDDSENTAEPFVCGNRSVQEFSKTKQQLFRGNRIDLQPPCDGLLKKMASGIPLGQLGIVRQGIAENPARINKKTNARFGDRWNIGQGVFSLTEEELQELDLPDCETTLIREYHDLSDLGRYVLSSNPSRRLIYSTRQTCSNIDDFPTLRNHLDHFRPIMLARRETRNGNNAWWHLHWPRDAALWHAPKVISVQMGRRPQFVAADHPVYVPFSTNVWIPEDLGWENLFFVTAILNSKLVWKWFQHNAKRRGIGLEINGKVLSQVPIPRVDSDDRKARIQNLSDLAIARHKLTNPALDQSDAEIDEVEQQIDSIVNDLFGLDSEDIRIVDEATRIHTQG